MSPDPQEISHTYDLSVVRSSLSKIRKGVEQGLNGDLRERASELSDDFSREEFKDWLETLSEEETSDLQRAVSREHRRKTLYRRKSKLSYIGDIDIESNSNTNDLIESLVTQLTTREATYYDAHFKFANAGAYIYNTEVFEGVIKEIKDNATGAHSAKQIFVEEARDRDDLGKQYVRAAESLSPIAGQLETAPKPRLIYFEDENHLFIEYWSLGKEDQIFDGQEGYSIEYSPRVRSAARIHIDSGVVEVFDGKKKETHRNTLLDRIERLFNPERPVADGGTQTGRTDVILRGKSISEDDIWKVMDEVGMLTTLEGFGGRTADAKLSAVQNRDVTKDDTHDDLRDDRGLELANIKIFFDDLEGRRMFIDPEDVGQKLKFDKDTTQSQMKDEIREEFGYTNIGHVTLTLNEDNNTIRIQKENCSPETRKTVFHLVTNTLGW